MQTLFAAGTRLNSYRIGAHKRVSSNSLAEDLHSQHISNDLFSFSVQVGVYQRYVVVYDDTVTESGQPLFNALNNDIVWERVANVSQLGIGACVGDQQALCKTRPLTQNKHTAQCNTYNNAVYLGISDSHTANESAPCDGTADDRDVLGKFALDGVVERLRATVCHETVFVC